MPATKPVDNEVKVPAAVARAASEAEAAHAAAYPKADPVTPSAEAPPPEQPIQTPDNTITITDITAPPPMEAQPSVTQQGNPDPNDGTWKHKFESVNGRYIRLKDLTDQQATTINDLRTQVEGLSDIIRSMQDMAPAPTEQTAPAPRSHLITDEDRKNYGDEFIDIVQRAARDAIGGDLDGIRSLVNVTDKKVTTVDTRIRAETDSQRKSDMEAALGREVPNWRDVNKDPEFMAWLGLPNPYTGSIRNDELQAAWAARKTPQVLAFFKGFVSEQAATAPPTLPNSTPATQPVQGVTLEELAAPGRARAPAANEPPVEKPIITRTQITAFYSDVQRGKYRGRDEEKNRLEAMIIAASREGRVR